MTESDIKITMTQNGAILDELNWHTGKRVKSVYEFEEDNLKGLQELLCYLSYMLVSSGSKYSKERIQVKVVHGRDYICKDNKCLICKEDK